MLEIYFVPMLTNSQVKEIAASFCNYIALFSMKIDVNNVKF